MAENMNLSGLPPDEPITLQANYEGKQSAPDNAAMLIQHLQHVIDKVEQRRIEQGSLHMEFVQGTQKIKIERLPDECDIKYYPTNEFIMFIHFRFED